MGLEMARLLLVGQGVKSINVNDVDDHPEAWTWLSGGPSSGAEKTAKDYFAKVPWLRRGVSIVATSVANIPFSIRGLSGDKELDNSEDYQNVVKFMPNPKRLLWLIAASRQLTGKAYVFKKRNKFVAQGLKYLIPSSVEPKYSDAEKTAGELIGFKRKVSTGKGGIKEIDLEIEDIVYSWYADPFTEVGPPLNYPALNALTASGVLFNLDEAVSGFFSRGMVKQTIFTVPGNTTREERERVENVLTRTLAGAANFFRAKVFNADAFGSTVIGEGLDNLGDGGLSKQKREDIAAAFGIPMSKLFSNESGGLGGGGVVEQDDKNFLNETLIPEAEAIFEDLNQQLFHPNKFHIEINTDNIDAFQEDEKERSASVLSLTSALSLNPEAFDLASSLLGYDLNDEQKAMLEAIKKDKSTQRELLQQRGFAQPAPKDTEQDKSVVTELAQWQRQALRVGGERSAAEFKTEHIPADLSAFLRAGLERCITEKNIKSLFSTVKKLRLTPALSAATRAALAKATTSKKVEAVFADLVANA